MHRALIGIVTLFIIGTGYGALNATTPHNYTQDAYRAQSLKDRATSPAPQATHEPGATQSPSIVPIKNEVKTALSPERGTESPTQTPRTTYSFIAREKGTVLSAMEMERAKGLIFTSKNYPALGVFIESIDGLKSTEGMYWILYLNGATSTSGASQAYVAPGDTVTWKYEAGY